MSTENEKKTETPIKSPDERESTGAGGKKFAAARTFLLRRRKFRHRIKLAIILPMALCLTLALLLLVFSFVSYYILVYPPFQQRIVRFAEEVAAEYLAGEVTIERFESDLLSYVNIYGLRAVGKSEYRDSVYVGHISVRYWIPALLSKRFHITSATITDVRGHVVMEEGNNIKLPFLPLYMLDSAYNLISGVERFTPEELAEAERLGIGLDSASQAELRKNWNTPEFRAIPKEFRQSLSFDIPKPSDWAWEVVIGRTRIDGLSAVYRDLANDMVGEIRNASITARFHSLDSFSVQLRVPGGSYKSPWWNGEIDTIGVDGTVMWTGIDVRHLLLKGAGTNVTASGKLCYFPDGPWDLEAKFVTSVRPVPVLYEFTPGLGKDGIFEGTATYKGRLYEPIWRAQVKGHNITYDGMRAGTMNVDAMFNRDEYGRARIRGNSEFGDYDVVASILMKDIMYGPVFGDYSTTANFSGLNMGRIAEVLKFELPLPVDTGNVRVSASGRSPDGVEFEIPSMIDVTAEIGGEKFAGERIDVQAVVRNAKDWEFNGSWGDNRVTGAGAFDIATGALSGAVQADVPHPAAAAMTFANERINGHIELTAGFDGRVDKLERTAVSADIKGNNIRWRGMFADSIEAQISFKDENLRVHRSSGHVSGHIDSLVTLFIGHDSIGGYVKADFSMRSEEDTDAISLNALVRGRELRYGEFTLDTLSGFAIMARDTVRWNGLYMKGMGASLRSSGRLKFKTDTLEIAASADLYDEYHGERALAGRVDVNGYMINDAISGNCKVLSVPLELFDPWIPEEHRLKGIATLSGEFSGTADNPSARVNFRLSNIGYGGYNVYSIAGDAVLADSTAVGAAVVRLGGKSAPVELKARVPLLPSSNWALDETGSREAMVGAQSRRFSLSEIAELFPEELKDLLLIGAASFDVGLTNSGAGWNLGGRVTLHDGFMRFTPEDVSVDNIRMNAALFGTLENPRVEFAASTGRARMPDLRMDRGVIRGRSGLDALEIDSARFVFRDTGVVDIRGRLSYEGIDSLFDNNDRFFARYRITNLPLSVFSRFLGDMNLNGGVFNGEGEIYGGNDRPLVNGTLALDDVVMELPDINPSIGPISATLSFTDSSVYVDTLIAKWGRGDLSGSGRALWNFEGLHDLDLRVRAADIAFELPEVVFVGVSDAELRATDYGGGYLISGRATLGPTGYVRDVNFIDLINQAQMGDVSRAPDPLLETILLHVDVDLDDNAGIDMNLGTLTVGGRVTLAGSLDNPGFVGRVNIRDGFVYYIDRKFNIVEGTLFNPDQNAINPNIRIIAKADVTTFSTTSRMEQFTITLSLTGTMEEPIIRFSAEPSLSELDILSILTFGERMGGLGSDINNRLANMAATQIMGIGARRLERLLNVDRVSVTGNIIGAGDHGSDMTIGTTKRFTNRLSVSYEINTGDQINQKATAQYRLLRNLFLEGQTTSMGENAVNLTYRYSR